MSRLPSIRPQPLITVTDVAAASRWYQQILGAMTAAYSSPVEVGEPNDTGETPVRIRDHSGLEIAPAQPLREFAGVGVEPDR